VVRLFSDIRAAEIRFQGMRMEAVTRTSRTYHHFHIYFAQAFVGSDQTPLNLPAINQNPSHAFADMLRVGHMDVIGDTAIFSYGFETIPF
jgi:hypothetical protein